MHSLLVDTLAPAAAARFVLMANHVLSAAPPAMERLKAHQGRSLQVSLEGLPQMPWLSLPAPPPLSLCITPAGLLEVPEADAVAASPELRLTVDASDPLGNARRVAAGEMPPVRIEGDAALAADISWILANVRWDVGADLERVFGPGLGGALAQGGAQVAAQMGQMAQAGAQGAAQMFKPR